MIVVVIVFVIVVIVIVVIVIVVVIVVVIVIIVVYYLTHSGISSTTNMGGHIAYCHNVRNQQRQLHLLPTRLIHHIMSMPFYFSRTTASRD